MFVLSVEGGAYLNRANWTTHKILGVGRTREEALATAEISEFDDEDILILTNVETGKAERIPTGEDESEEDEEGDEEGEG